VNASNTVEVEVGDGSLSADAPTPKVSLNYSHEAASTQSVTYTGEAWSERWNTSRTWASDREDASLTIPFSENVVAARDVTLLVNGSEVAPASTTFNDTSLRVGLGDVSQGQTTRVVANGSKVRTVNGSIKVTDPTPEGQQLDTAFKITDRSPGFHIEVGSTAKSRWLHYLTSESWNDASEYAIVTKDAAQSIYLPNAPAGGTARARALALHVEPQHDVRIHVAQPGSLVLDVQPGTTTGDDVTFEYAGASSGTEYELVSLDRDGYRIDLDTGATAVLLGDDSAETLQIRPVNSSSSTSSLVPAGGGGGAPISEKLDPRANPYALLAMVGGLMVVLVAIAEYKPHDAIPTWVVIPVMIPVTIIVIATQSPGTIRLLIAGQLGGAVKQVGPALLLLGGATGTYLVYKAAQKWLGPDRTTLNIETGGKK